MLMAKNTRALEAPEFACLEEGQDSRRNLQNTAKIVKHRSIHTSSEHLVLCTWLTSICSNRTLNLHVLIRAPQQASDDPLSQETGTGRSHSTEKTEPESEVEVHTVCTYCRRIGFP